MITDIEHRDVKLCRRYTMSRVQCQRCRGSRFPDSKCASAIPLHQGNEENDDCCRGLRKDHASDSAQKVLEFPAICLSSQPKRITLRKKRVNPLLPPATSAPYYEN